MEHICHKVSSGRHLSQFFLVILFCFVFVCQVNGQGAPQVQRILDEPFRLQMDDTSPFAKRAVFDWGGWFRSSIWTADDNVDRDYDGRDDGYHTLRRQQLRLWGQFNIDTVHRFYCRGRLDYLDWNHGTSYDHNDSDWDGADLDRLWYDFSVARALRAYYGENIDYDFSIRVGRQYVKLGTGLALSTPLDAVLMKASVDSWELSGLLALSVTDAYNIDQSVPDNSKESRRYWGVQLQCKHWPDHEPFAYYYSQVDNDGGSIRRVQTGGGSYNQSFGYDSSYVGLGSRGRFFHRDLEYTCEMVAQQGKSYAWSGVGDRQNIDAWAFDTELRYIVPDSHKSELRIEYLLASGDGDRRYCPMGTVGGNSAHTPDRSFGAWGFRNTGLSLAPDVSNLGMVRLGASTFPINEVKRFEKLLVGVDLFLYHKQQREAAMSDSMSLDNGGFLGTGIDLYAGWRITSDVALTVRYGIFMPGDGFTEHADRQLFFSGVTVNF